MTDNTADEELVFADQILHLLNNSDEETEDKVIESDDEPIKPIKAIQTNHKTLELIDDNQDIFAAQSKPIDSRDGKHLAEQLFGELSDEEFDSRPHLTQEGKQIEQNLKNDSRSVSLFETRANYKSNNWNKMSKNSNSNANEDIIREVFSGIRLINPLISSHQMKELMSGRKMVKMSLIKSQMNKTTNDIEDDWVTIGIVIAKMPPKISKNGKQYSIWKLSDMKTKNVVTFFLFGDVYAEHWKVAEGSVIGLLNPKIMSDDKYDKNSKYGKNEICSLTIDNSAKLLMVGTAKDLSRCNAAKKNGDKCNAVINLAEGEYCVYHIKTAYKRFSCKRAELQTTFSNCEPKKFQINSNNCLFSTTFAENESKDMPIIETKKFNSSQFMDKKSKELEKLSKIVKNPISKAAKNLFLSINESKEEKTNSKSSVLSAKDIFNSIKREKNNSGYTQFSAPTLAKGYKSGQMIDLSSKSDHKLRAIQSLKIKPIQTQDPNAVKKNTNKRSLERIISKIDTQLKSSNDCEESEEERKTKKLKNDLIEKALNRKSIHDNEVEIAEINAQHKYFTSLEKKEKMEEKLSQIFEMECDVISCHVCKYTAHSASELCQKSRHKLVRHKATKRFFKCKNCQNRSFAFNILLPTKPCSKCGQTSYTKTSIVKIKEETSLLDKKLLIRGEESKFLNN